MLRLVVIWSSACLAVAFVVLAKMARADTAAFAFLGMGMLAFFTWLYALSTASAPRAGEPRASVFRLVGLWMRTKEKDLQARLDQKS